MIRVRKGKIVKLYSQREGIQEAIVEVEGETCRAVNYPLLTGDIHENDEVILNTTAVHLGLGTGGVHFVIFNYSNTAIDPPEMGHIMKLRYTPFQVKCLCEEEEESALGERIKNIQTLDGMPVLACSLHSMLAPACAAIKNDSPNTKLAYIMTDGGALPLFFSSVVALLKKRGFIDVCISCGHAFGGDMEAVNLYSGLICARAWGADAAIVAMGPGIVGTDTKYGHTGIEQGEIINAVTSLQGKPVAIPRISFSDLRERHRGLSHHTITALSVIAKDRAFVVIPSDMEEEKRIYIDTQIKDSGIDLKHLIATCPGTAGLQFLEKNGIPASTMGRSIKEDRDYFLSCSAAGHFLTGLL